MNERSRPEPDPRHAGGEWVPSAFLLALAAGILVGALAWWWWPSPPEAMKAAEANAPTLAADRSPAPAHVPESSAEPTAPAPSPVGTAPARVASLATAAGPRIARTREPGDDPTPDLSDYINEGERPTMAEVIDRLHQAGVHGGLGAFQPPGTRPPLVGLAVPEDFQLPEGYVRHHQATDDGQRIEAILMFAPDREFIDASGRAVAIPANRVVPPELAPPGLPLRQIVVPELGDMSRPRS